MTHLTLSCPRCHKPLVYVPLDGFTLHYRCVDHGAIILRPLIAVEAEDEFVPAAVPNHDSMSAGDAA